MLDIIGIDEVGRGCVAGPVVLSGVKFSTAYPLLTHSQDQTDEKWKAISQGWQNIRDSKKIPSTKRQQISESILNSKPKYFIFYADNKLIDQFGIGFCLSHMVLLGIFYLTKDTDPFQSRAIIDGKIKILSELDLISSGSIPRRLRRSFPYASLKLV